MSHTVVILGGSYAGLKIAHTLLKSSLPNVKDLKIILVNPSPKFFWNMATVRAIVPGQIKDEQLFQDIAPGFAYAGAAFEFVQGTAQKLNVENKTVEVQTESGVRLQAFDKLVIATGSKADADTPWKHGESYEQTLQYLHSMQDRVAAAESIVVGGGGSTGTEAVAELGFEYGTKKDISLVRIVLWLYPHIRTHSLLDYYWRHHNGRLDDHSHQRWCRKAPRVNGCQDRTLYPYSSRYADCNRSDRAYAIER